MDRVAVRVLLVTVLVAAGPRLTAQTVDSQAQEAFARGVALQQKGDLEGARQAYEEALGIAPQRVDVLSNLGLVYSEMGQQERAIKCYQEALKVDPKQYAVRFNLGIAYMQANQYEPARRELAKVVAAQPNNLRAHYLLGLCLLKQGRLPEGTAELERVRRANAKDLDVSYTLASAYLKANQLDKAEPIVTGLETVDSAEAHYIVGSYYLAKFDHHRAVRELEMAVKQNPKLPEAHSQLAYAYFFDFKWDLSVKMCEEELPYTPTTGTLSNCWVRSIGRGDDWMRQPRFWTRRPAKARTTPRFCIKSDFSLRPRTTNALQWPFLRRSPS